MIILYFVYIISVLFVPAIIIHSWYNGVGITISDILICLLVSFIPIINTLVMVGVLFEMTKVNPHWLAKIVIPGRK